jgi:hypothetical protein
LALIHIARTLRWGNLMAGLEKVPFQKLNEASAIGFMMLIILPFRLGEFARPFLIAERSNIRRSPAMTSVVLERIIDGLLIAVLLRGRARALAAPRARDPPPGPRKRTRQSHTGPSGTAGAPRRPRASQ